MNKTIAKPDSDQANPVVPEGPVTYEEFLAWAGETTRAEWVNGEIVPMSPVSVPHQLLVNFLITILSEFTQAHGLGVVLSAPVQMKLKAGREPDVCFVATENLGRLRENYIDGPADLVIEVISPESRARDRGDKYYEYEEGGVREYWLLDTARRQAEFYVLSEDGYYHPVSVEGGIYRSAVLEDLFLKTEWFFQEPLPLYADIRREWNLP
ncbi:MAG TPA: Uma2 family endonuclease [Armatimonadota bacterium]|nr:Uma2 family endonuclease [Armatimonadota bacterium]